MDIEKTPNKRKVPSPLEETQNQETQVAKEKTTSESASKTKTGARRVKTVMKSSYKEYTTRDTKMFQQTEKRVRTKKKDKR